MIKNVVLPVFLFLNLIVFAQLPSERDLPQKKFPALEEKGQGEESTKMTECGESGMDSIQQADCYFSLGIAFQNEQDLEKAKIAFEKASVLYSENKEAIKAAQTLNKLGEIHLRPTTFWRALEYYQKAKIVSSQAGSSEALIESFKGLAKVYEELYMYREALEFRRKYEALVAEFRKAKFSDQVKISERKNQEQENKLLEQTREIEVLRNKYEKLNTQRNIGIITTSFAGILAFLAIGYSVKKKKEPGVKNVVKTQPLQNQEEEERLKNSNIILEDLTAGLTKIHSLSSVIAHKTSYLQDVKENSEMVKSTSGKMLERMGDLLWVLNRGGASLSALINRVQLFAQEQLKETGIKPVFHISEDLPEINITGEVRTGLYGVVKESLENVANHSAANRVIISANIHREILLITIIDNGNGFIVGDHNPGKGLGNMKETMEKIGGAWEVSSKIGQGTMISISVCLENIKV